MVSGSDGSVAQKTRSPGRRPLLDTFGRDEYCERLLRGMETPARAYAYCVRPLQSKPTTPTSGGSPGPGPALPPPPHAYGVPRVAMAASIAICAAEASPLPAGLWLPDGGGGTERVGGAGARGGACAGRAAAAPGPARAPGPCCAAAGPGRGWGRPPA